MIDIAPFSLLQVDKEKRLYSKLYDLTCFHYENCPAYQHIFHALGFSLHGLHKCEDFPFFPVNLFKNLELRSIAVEEIFKVLTSSGTTGQQVSKIYLDRHTASAQQKILAQIVMEFMGAKRMPMLIIDCPSVVKDRTMFSARGAGVLGFSIFGTDRTYALNDDMSLNFHGIHEFLERHTGERILLFGFTFMVWQYFCEALARMNCTPDISRGILFHGGGWKKIANAAVSPAAFRQRLSDVCGLTDVHNYYGMVEQTGSICVECEQGHLHPSIYSDVIVRRHHDFSPCACGEPGIIQMLSELPHSYPGHSLLTEDEGVLIGVDDCPCGRKGRYFSVSGRLKHAELRGCSDTYEHKS